MNNMFKYQYIRIDWDIFIEMKYIPLIMIN